MAKVSEERVVERERDPVVVNQTESRRSGIGTALLVLLLIIVLLAIFWWRPWGGTSGGGTGTGGTTNTTNISAPSRGY